MRIKVNDQSYDVEHTPDAVTVNDTKYTIRVQPQDNARIVFVNDFPYRVELPDSAHGDGPLTVLVDGHPHAVEVEGRMRAATPPPRKAAASPKPSGPAPRGALTASMAGRIVSVRVAPGDAVKAGQVLLVLEAMKMENEVAAPRDATIKEAPVAPGARVNEGDVLILLEE